MRFLLCVGGLVLAGCAVGDGGGEPGGISADLADTRAPWLVLDLDTGALRASVEAPDLSRRDLRDRLMAFRRVPATAIALGAPADELGRQDDEAEYRVELAAYYIAAFECTQAQWVRLAGARPWADVGAAAEDALPASHLTFAAAIDLRDHLRGRFAGGMLDLPSDAEWERACRAGSTASFHWGEDRTASTAARYATVGETRASDQPAAVGSRHANALGLCDLHGNVWEFTRAGDLRGGSWADPLALARAANRQEIAPDTPLPSAGVRWCWRPAP